MSNQFAMQRIGLRKDPGPALEMSTQHAKTVIIPTIQTSAMAIAKARGEIPFAVLHMRNEIPLIVRVLEQGAYSVLKAAENSDFRESQGGGPGLEETKRVSIAVVATIYERYDGQGKCFYEIFGPNSCYVTEKIPQLNSCNDVWQDSLDRGNMYKTLTELNAADFSYSTIQAPQHQLPVLRPHAVNGPAPSGSGSNVLKRKIAPKSKSAAPIPNPQRILPKKPKVIAVSANHLGGPVHSRKAHLSERNFQEIATGSLLSPERSANQRSTNWSVEAEAVPIEAEDPFRDIDVMDLIRTGNELLSSAMDVDVEDPQEGVYIPVV